VALILAVGFITDRFAAAGTAQARLITVTLAVAVNWWLAMLVLTAILRPTQKRLRLAALDDRAARGLHTLAASAILLGQTTLAMLPLLLLHLGLSVPSTQTLALVMAIIAALLVGVGLVRLLPALSTLLGRSVLGVAILLALCWIIGVLLVDLAVFDASVRSLAIILIAYLIDGLAGLSAANRMIGTLRRCVRLASVLIIARIMITTWLVGQFELISEEEWRATNRHFVGGAIVVLVGYLAWEGLRYWMDVKFAPPPPPSAIPADDDVEATPASRIHTLMPLFRVLAAISILVLTVLVALAELGINTAPLIAGASIFGLAISFGSQALVRDIVSGIFFIADDAFRIGEYIDTGKLKGTVEAISVRSVKLRHQNGQVHTIPFGQLGSITNFSRDWATVKFNLRLVRGVDIELVRKTVKKIGQDMQDDPDLAAELIQPLKMQGVADVADNALIVRLKFTAKPGKPSWVQREALKRIVKTFAEKGIDFASNAVTVQGALGPEAIAGAAASTATPPTVEPRPA
jgi:moderate conductance mechanosensitive channel